MLDVDCYIDAISDIEGWSDPEDAEVFALLDDLQQPFRTCGHIVEAYLGTSTSLLGYMKKENEQLVVVDSRETPTTEKINRREHEISVSRCDPAEFRAKESTVAF